MRQKILYYLVDIFLVIAFPPPFVFMIIRVGVHLGYVRMTKLFQLLSHFFHHPQEKSPVSLYLRHGKRVTSLIVIVCGVQGQKASCGRDSPIGKWFARQVNEYDLITELPGWYLTPSVATHTTNHIQTRTRVKNQYCDKSRLTPCLAAGTAPQQKSAPLKTQPCCIFHAVRWIFHSSFVRIRVRRRAELDKVGYIDGASFGRGYLCR